MLKFNLVILGAIAGFCFAQVSEVITEPVQSMTMPKTALVGVSALDSTADSIDARIRPEEPTDANALQIGESGATVHVLSNMGVGMTSGAAPYRLTIVGNGSIFGIDNQASFVAKNSSGSYDTFFWPRWSDNIMYMNYGTGGFHLRDNGSNSAVFITGSRDVGIGTTSPGAKLDVVGNIKTSANIVQGSLVARPYATWSVGGSSTGAVIIKLPGNTSNYGMLHIEINVYEYSGLNASTYIIGGHNWGNAWHNYGCNTIGLATKPVRLAVKDGQYAIVIGNPSSSWSYGHVVLSKITTGGYYSGIMDLGGTYSITQDASAESYTWISGDLNRFNAGNAYFSGNVGIGTASPGARLHIADSYPIVAGSDGMLKVKSLGTTYGSETISLQTSIDNRTDDYTISGYGGDSRHILALQPQGGYVGIGTANPTEKLSINGSVTTQNGQIKRDFAVWNTTASSSNPIHIKTNITWSNIMYRILVEGYNYGVGQPINSEIVGYCYSSSPSAPINASAINHASGASISQYKSDDGYLVVKLSSSSFYYVGFSVSAWLTNPTINAFDIKALLIVQQASDLVAYTPGSQTFSYTGGVQTFTVPTGVTSISVDVRGAQGGYGYPSTSRGGYGGRVTGTYSVTAGQVLYVYVGGVGISGAQYSAGSGGYNGGAQGALYSGSFSGGGGGGASDIRVSPYGTANRIFVAGGGGGGAYNYSNTDYDRGGNGGSTIGEAGYSGNTVGGTAPGGGGAQSYGGAGGYWSGYCYGNNGSLGAGGSGATSCTNSGGGGGGGYYGGGGGCWAGGGGGSSYPASGVTHTQGFQSGNGQVTISW